MNRLNLLCAICLAPLVSSVCLADHGQHIHLNPGLNYITIIVEQGDNTLPELLPGAPVGTVVFKFDNAFGYQVSQLYSNGWSDAGMTLKPRETAIIMPPSDRSHEEDLEAERAYPMPPIYRGWNLVPIEALYPLPPIIEKILPREGDEIWAPVPGGFVSAMFSHAEQRWIGLRIPRDGMWYYAKDWPANPSGQFDLRGAIYFNNFAPAFGVDEPFLDEAGCPLNGTATLLKQSGANMWDALGEKIPVADGYIDRSQDLMRYVPPMDELATVTLALSLETSQGTRRSAPFDVRPWKGLYPVGLSGFEWGRRPRFVNNPQWVSAAAGTAAELKATYNYRSSDEPELRSLQTVEECAEKGGTDCRIMYQWQRLTPTGQWEFVQGATNSVLRFENVTDADYGIFRLRAAWGCREDFSTPAKIFRPVGLTILPGSETGTFALNISAFELERVHLQLSNDLRNWQTYATAERPANTWQVTVPDTASKIFFRVLAMP